LGLHTAALRPVHMRGLRQRMFTLHRTVAYTHPAPPMPCRTCACMTTRRWWRPRAWPRRWVAKSPSSTSTRRRRRVRRGAHEGRANRAPACLPVCLSACLPACVLQA
jgi:hypothetical protein